MAASATQPVLYYWNIKGKGYVSRTNIRTNLHTSATHLIPPLTHELVSVMTSVCHAPRVRRTNIHAPMNWQLTAACPCLHTHRYLASLWPLLESSIRYDSNVLYLLFTCRSIIALHASLTYLLIK